MSDHAPLSCLNNLVILMILITSVVRLYFGPLCAILPISCASHSFFPHIRAMKTMLLLFVAQIPHTDHSSRLAFSVTMSFPIHPFAIAIYFVYFVYLKYYCWLYCNSFSRVFFSFSLSLVSLLSLLLLNVVEFVVAVVVVVVLVQLISCTCSAIG